jgi:LuxR family maltose regulon positive regulatory protein
MHVGKSRVAYERNDITASRDHLLASEQLGGAAALAQNPYRSRVALARIRVVEGHVEAALSLLDEAEGLYASDFYPNIQPIPAVKARIWIALGRADEALGWAREYGVSADDELSYVREFDHMTLARLLALTERTTRQPSSRRGAELLERLRNSAEGGGRAGSLIEILVLQALGHSSRGEAGAALESLDRALTLAEPQGHVRVFLDEGPAIAGLLETAVRQGVASTYASHLLAAARDDALGARANRALVEPLSERELEVLRLLASDMDGPAIAAALVVSLHTVRSHTKKVYAKLDVGDRRAAVRRGSELNLLPGAHSR